MGLKGASPLSKAPRRGPPAIGLRALARAMIKTLKIHKIILEVKNQ